MELNSNLFKPHGGFKYCLFSALPGEMIQFGELIFFKGVDTIN